MMDADFYADAIARLESELKVIDPSSPECSDKICQIVMLEMLRDGLAHFEMVPKPPPATTA